MFTVVKLGGCNGSGKTSVARALLAHLPFKPFAKENGAKVRYYSWQGEPGNYDGLRIVVLGSYETVCGGMDTISDKDDRLALLKASCKPNTIVFYEGLITGKTYGKMGELCEEQERKGKGRWVWAFMDTPFDVCVERVLKRRAAKGNVAEFDPMRTMDPTFRSCQRLEQKLRNGELPAPTKVLSLKHKRAPAKLAQDVLNCAMEIHHAS